MSLGSIGQPVDASLAALGRAAATLATAATVIALFTVSNMLLTEWGIDYETPGGSPLSKVHPASYLAALSLGLLLLSRLDPVDLLDDIVQQHKGLVIFFAAFLFLLGNSVLAQGFPFTMVFDTFFTPMALLVLLPRMGERALRRLALALHAVMFANAVIALAEFALGERLTPMTVQGVALTSDWRSSALIGHPLANAAATGVYILGLILGGGRDLPGPMRVVMFAVQLPAMAVFGGRAALVIALGVGSFLALRNMARVVAGRRITLPGAMTLAIILPAAALAVGVLVSTGFFDRFLDRFVSDDGSAATRVNMFALLAQIPLRELVLGPDPELVATLQRLEGLEFGIESFWVAFVAFYGFLVSIPFFIGFTYYLLDLWRSSRPQAGWLIVYFIVVASTSASLSGKTTSLGIFVATVLVLFRRSAHLHVPQDREAVRVPPRGGA